MITTKNELKFYLECDRLALGTDRKKPKVFGDEIWKFERTMRLLDYYTQKRSPVAYWYRFIYHKQGIRLGFTIPFDISGPGLSIAHYGYLVISSNAQIGANCRIHSGVNIGASGGRTEAAVVGDNVYIGPGAKIIGNVKIGNNAVIGANAVVVNDVESGVTVGGVPAMKISDRDSSCHLIKATELRE